MFGQQHHQVCPLLTLHIMVFVLFPYIPARTLEVTVVALRSDEPVPQQPQVVLARPGLSAQLDLL